MFINGKNLLIQERNERERERENKRVREKMESIMSRLFIPMRVRENSQRERERVMS